MTLEELKRDWKKYTFIHNDGESAPLRRMYFRYMGEHEKGGLLFHMKISVPEKDIICELVNVDEYNNFYAKIAINDVLIDTWVHIGKLVKSRAFRRQGCG
jgi:hypothetical protein